MGIAVGNPEGDDHIGGDGYCGRNLDSFTDATWIQELGFLFGVAFDSDNGLFTVVGNSGDMQLPQIQLQDQ